MSAKVDESWSWDNLVEMEDNELEMALIEWKRWRDRVRHAETMRRREARFAQASSYIEAIERELALRSPAGRDQLRRDAESAVEAAAGGKTVALDAFRAARDQLAIVKRRMTC